MSVEETKAIDPCALATLTTGIVMCDWSKACEAAEWLLGYPVWTHEYIDPVIQKAIIDAIKAQFPDMPQKPIEDWQATAAEVRERYGETVDVVRGTLVRDRDPMETLLKKVGDRAEIIVVDPGDGNSAPLITRGNPETSDD